MEHCFPYSNPSIYLFPGIRLHRSSVENWFQKNNLVVYMCRRTRGGAGHPTPGVQPLYPAQFFLTTPPPFFSLFFAGTPPQIRIFCPLPRPIWPPPIFRKKPPFPRPLTPGPPTTLSSPTWFIVSKFALWEHWAMENWTDIHINHGHILIKCPSVSDSLSTGSVATWIHDSISWVFHWWLKYEM